MKLGLLSGVVCVGLLASAGEAKTVYVDGVNGNDAWSGLCEVWDGGACGPKASISGGIGVAEDGDLVRVADAVYTGSKNRKIKFFGKAITVQSANGAENCIVDCGGSADPAFQFDAGETLDSVLDGIMVKNCYGC